MPLEGTNQPPYYAIIQPIIVPRKYKAYLDQDAANAPYETLYENTLGANFVWTRVAAGEYLGTSPIPIYHGPIPNISQIGINIKITQNADYNYSIVLVRFITDKVLQIFTAPSGFGAPTADDILRHWIEIELYDN